jgi:DNA modification methylase
VLDPFIGSGTTAIVCLNLKRHYIGIEAMDHYYQLAQDVINEWNENNSRKPNKVDLWSLLK